MDIYAAWAEYKFAIIMSGKMKTVMVMTAVVLFAVIVCLTTMRNRTTSTQTEAGTWAASPAAKAKGKAKAASKAASKAEAKAQPKSRPRATTATPTEDWLGDTWLLDPDPDDSVEDHTEDDAAGGRSSAASSSAATARPTARRQSSPKMPVTTLVACSRRQHTMKVGRNSSSVYVTCMTCRHHAAWLPAGAGPGQELVFDTVTNLMLQRAWRSLTGL